MLKSLLVSSTVVLFSREYNWVRKEDCRIDFVVPLMARTRNRFAVGTRIFLLCPFAISEGEKALWGW